MGIGAFYGPEWQPGRAAVGGGTERIAFRPYPALSRRIYGQLCCLAISAIIPPGSASAGTAAHTKEERSLFYSASPAAPERVVAGCCNIYPIGVLVAGTGMVRPL